ncbi:hypothetical protein BIW11_03788, partial [Tropilaelaps mercedesae]
GVCPGGQPRPGQVQLAGQLATPGGHVVTTGGVAGSPSPEGGGVGGKELLGVGAPAVNVICASPNMNEFLRLLRKILEILRRCVVV